MTPDLAGSLRFEATPRGGPPRPPAAPIAIPDLLLSVFDNEMATWERRFGSDALDEDANLQRDPLAEATGD